MWTRNEGPRTWSRQRQHSSAVRITVIIYTIVTNLDEDCEKETQAAGETVKQDTQQTVTKRERDTGTKATDILQTVQTKSKLPLCMSPSLLGTQRDFHVSALCVEDRSPPSAPTIDAIHRRRHSKPPSTPTIEAIHRRHPSTPPFVATIVGTRGTSTSVHPCAIHTIDAIAATQAIVATLAHN